MCHLPQEILDVGCATGLSSLALLRCYPEAHVTGVDLSPYMLAVGAHLQHKREVRGGAGRAFRLLPACCPCALLLSRRPAWGWWHSHDTLRLTAGRLHLLAPPPVQKESGCKEGLTFKHAAAEDTGLPDGCMDLVSICLVCHELPQVRRWPNTGGGWVPWSLLLSLTYGSLNGWLPGWQLCGGQM